jgi:4-cresol dehydrogenase (hydroxylating)
MKTPPGITEAQFAAALKEFAKVVGDDWVLTSDEDLNTYRDAYSPYLGEAEERWASAALAPDNTEEVQKIVVIANTYGIPIYPISTGKNLGYGGTAPSYSGSVVIDLKRMNRVLEINEDRAFVLVEPGVSYFELYRYIREKGLKLWIDTPDPGWGSLIGNALERGSGYTLPNIRNHFEAHCGMEVVLANGELVRTGMGALPTSQTWQQHKTGFGPIVDGLFSQSNMGIVTKMGFWMMPEPDAYLKCHVLLPRYKDLNQFVPILNYLENTATFNGTPDFGSPLLANPQIADWPYALEGSFPAIAPEHGELLKTMKLGYSPELEAYGLAHDIAYWKVALPFYGPAKAIAAQWDYAKEKLSVIPGVRFEDHDVIRLPLSDDDREKIHLPELGIPSLKNFIFGARSALNPNPSHGHMWFAPIIPRTGEAIYKANEVFAEVSARMGVPIQFSFALPACYWERNFVIICGFGVTEDPAQNAKSRAMFRELIKVCAAHGWSEYRTATVFQDDVVRELSFNNHALLRLQQTIKDAVDPKGILSPGRYGIWPKHLREKT